MEFFNLTPHAVTIQSSRRTVVVPPSGLVLRVSSQSRRVVPPWVYTNPEPLDDVGFCDYFHTEYWDFEIFDCQTQKVFSDAITSPETQLRESVDREVDPNTVYIVSGLCLDLIKNRVSVWEKSEETKRNENTTEWIRCSIFAAPGELIRDASGQPIACKGLRL